MNWPDPPTEPRSIRAAANNADWYAMMFDLHGLRYERSPLAFLALDAPPAYHSRVVILDPGAGDVLTEQIVTDAGQYPGFTCKDSFRRLDLGPHGMSALFDASWIWVEEVRARISGWRRITDVGDLHLWEVAWTAAGSPSDRRQFPDGILERSDVAVFARHGPNGFEAGGVANISDDCVGLSNCFGHDAIGPAAALAQRFGDGRPVTGYERGTELDLALDAGFEVVGSLRVWSTSSG